MKQLTKKRKTTKYIVMTALFTALGYVLSFFEVPMPAPIAFLKLDFSNVMTMLCGFALGPLSMVISEAVKQLLWFVTHSTTGGVGEIANFLVAVSYALVPAIAYRHKKGVKNVIFALSIGCLLQVAGALTANYFITFPLYMGEAAKDVFLATLPYLIAFNLGKSVLISGITMVLYKSLSRALKTLFGTEDEQGEKVVEQTQEER